MVSINTNLQVPTCFSTADFTSLSIIKNIEHTYYYRTEHVYKASLLLTNEFLECKHQKSLILCTTELRKKRVLRSSSATSLRITSVLRSATNVV